MLCVYMNTEGEGFMMYDAASHQEELPLLMGSRHVLNPYTQYVKMANMSIMQSKVPSGGGQQCCMNLDKTWFVIDDEII